MAEDFEASVTNFKNLLTKFLEEDHQVIDDTCLEKLLTHLSAEGIGQKLLQLPECRTFCQRSLQAFEKGIVSESLLAFALRLHGLVIGIEVYFMSSDLQESTLQITLAPRLHMTSNASIQCAFVQMVTALLSHKCGVDWLAKSDVWKTVQNLYEKNHSMYVARECQKFLSIFICKLGVENIEIQNQMIKSPLRSISINQHGSLSLNLALDLTTQILEVAFKEGSHEIPLMLEPHLSKSCDELLAIAVDDSAILGRVARILVLLSFALTEVSEKHLAELEETVLQTIARLIGLKNVAVVQNTTLQCQIYWSILQPRVSSLNQQYQLDHQLVYIQVMPLLQKNLTEIKKDCVRNFLDKLCAHTTPNTQHLGCRLRSLVLASNNPQQLACKGIHSLLQMKDVISRDTAIFVFRTLMCILVQFIGGSSEEIDEAQNSGFMGTTLESIVTLIDHYHFTWRESVETTCLLTYMQELLCEPALGQRQASQVLRVMRRSIEDFMPPNLALLTNTLDNSPLQNLGPQLYRCLHNISWEIRDGALEVLSTIAHIAKDKFPAFQDHLLQHKLCSLAVSMVIGDEESYVRVSALNCLSTMVAVPCFWEKCLHQEHLPELVTKILCQESEGIVRREAAALVNTMLHCKRFSNEERERMYIVMASTAATDLHWEVKLNTLNFWQSSINQQTSEQGMIDGKFPSVTFSGPSRKIVTLDTPEVQARLGAVLAELARTRCLAVLLTTLQDPDLQVARKSAEILTKLQTLLREHGLTKEKTTPAVNPTPDISSLEVPTSKSQNGALRMSSEQVIDGIVGQSDLALLALVCRTQLNLEDEAMPPTPVPTPHGVALVKPEEFLEVISSVDLEEVIASRTNWLEHCSEHLDSLLADMLEAREFQHNTNDMDCY